MKTILIVIKKELRDTLRDKRTLISAILLPAIVFPLMIVGMTKIENEITESAATKVLNVAMIDAPGNFKDYFTTQDDVKTVTYTDAEAARNDVESDSLDAVLEFAPGFASNLDRMEPAPLKVYYKSTQGMALSRLSEKIKAMESTIMEGRLEKMNISPAFLAPIAIEPVNVISANEEMAEVIASVFPMIFIIFCFIGCMYPAIDLITGEKEKGTIETLLTVPASRFHILIGKMATISLVGLISALLTITGMVVTMTLTSGAEASASMTEGFGEIVSVKAILMILFMLIPLSVFFSGLLTAVVVRTKSFKESQSIVTPMTFMVVAPAIFAISPGMELNSETAWIPIFNMALAIKEIVAGTISIEHYTIILCSLTLIAVGAAWMSFRHFSKENMILN